MLSEPSVVAYDKDTNQIKAIGEEARLMIGRTPGNIAAVRPLRQGVISDYTVHRKNAQIFYPQGHGPQDTAAAPGQRVHTKRSDGGGKARGY